MSTFFLVLGLGIAGLLVYAATRPGTFEVRRAITITAPAETIFAIVNDFHTWAQWSPYDERDPDMKRLFSGASEGVGAIYEWNGNKQVGQGRIEIVEIVRPTRISMTLDMIRPFPASNHVHYTFQQTGADTRVVWALQGPSPYLSRLIGLFMNMDRMVGSDFETGLARLKALAEGRDAAKP